MCVRSDAPWHTLIPWNKKWKSCRTFDKKIRRYMIPLPESSNQILKTSSFTISFRTIYNFLLKHIHVNFKFTYFSLFIFFLSFPPSSKQTTKKGNDYLVLIDFTHGLNFSSFSLALNCLFTQLFIFIKLEN